MIDGIIYLVSAPQGLR